MEDPYFIYKKSRKQCLLFPNQTAPSILILFETKPPEILCSSNALPGLFWSCQLQILEYHCFHEKSAALFRKSWCEWQNNGKPFTFEFLVWILCKWKLSLLPWAILLPCKSGLVHGIRVASYKRTSQLHPFLIIREDWECHHLGTPLFNSPEQDDFKALSSWPPSIKEIISQSWFLKHIHRVCLHCN